MGVKHHRSLKRDYYPYEKDGNVYWFAGGRGIDCFHRLRLTQKSLDLLLKIGRLERRAILPGNELIAEDCSIKACELWEKFREQFKNPYHLDVEFVQPDGDKYPLMFCFYDYDFSYYLEWCVEACLESNKQGAWSIYCTRSFYTDPDESEIEIDTI